MKTSAISDIRQKYPWLAEVLDTQREEIKRLQTLNDVLIGHLRQAAAELTHLAEIHDRSPKAPTPEVPEK